MAQAKSGTFTGDGTATVQIDIGFEPDCIIVDSGISTGTAGTQGLLCVALVKGSLSINYYHNSSTDTSERTYNKRINSNDEPWGGDGGAYRSIASYSNGVFTVSNKTLNNANVYFINNQTYSWTAYKA